MALTPKQAKFVELYLELGNAAEAYRRVYDPGESTINTRQPAYELLKNPDIAATLDDHREASKNATVATLAGLMNFHAKICAYDPNEIIRNRRGACRHCHGDEFRRQWREPEYMDALKEAERLNAPLPDYGGGFGYKITRDPHPDCPMCDGVGVEHIVLADTTKLSETARAGYHGLKVTKDGYQVIMPDRQKSAEALARLLGVGGDNVRISSDFGQLAAAIKLEGTNPEEAARIYQKLMSTTFAA